MFEIYNLVSINYWGGGGGLEIYDKIYFLLREMND